MQLTGCHNGNEIRNATCVDTQIFKLIGPTVHPYTVVLASLTFVLIREDMKAVPFTGVDVKTALSPQLF